MKGFPAISGSRCPIRAAAELVFRGRDSTHTCAPRHRNHQKGCSTCVTGDQHAQAVSQPAAGADASPEAAAVEPPAHRLAKGTVQHNSFGGVINMAKIQLSVSATLAKAGLFRVMGMLPDAALYTILAPPHFLPARSAGSRNTAR